MAEIFENEAVRTEGELYKSVNVYGKIFDLYYGYYEDIDREGPLAEPMPIHPDLKKNPQYTDDGFPIVTKMQNACVFYDGVSEQDVTCGLCNHLEGCEELFGVCRCRANQKGTHLISVLTDRLGLQSALELKKPEYRERILEEIKSGDIKYINTDEMRELLLYIAPPLKVLLYGTSEDKELLTECQYEETYFSEIQAFESLEDYTKALDDSSFDIIVCMKDRQRGVEGLKAAYEKCPDKPLMWFPETAEEAAASYRYGCVFAQLKGQMNFADLTFGIKNCRRKLKEKLSE